MSVLLPKNSIQSTDPKHLPQNVEITELQYNADFESEAIAITKEQALPNPNTLRTVTMRGHDGSYHSQDLTSAKRHTAYHDLQNTPNIHITEDDLVNIEGDKSNGPFLYDPTRYDYWLKTHHISKSKGGLIQKGYNAGPDSHNNKNRAAFHTSWLQTICRQYVNGIGNTEITDLNIEQRDGYNVINFAPKREVGVFTKNVYFEMDVDYSRMKTGAHRHSWWWMTVNPNTAYDNDYNNGTEIDGVEHEVNDDPFFSDLMFIKCLGGARNTANSIKAGVEKEILIDGSEVNVGTELIMDDKNEEARMFKEGAIRVPGINNTGSQIIALLWEVDSTGKGRLRFFVNGIEVVRDTELVPLNDTEMYMILSREANEEHGLSGKSVYDFLGTVDEDEVLVKSVRAWKTAEPNELEKNPSRVCHNVNTTSNSLVEILKKGNNVTSANATSVQNKTTTEYLKPHLPSESEINSLTSNNKNKIDLNILSKMELLLHDLELNLIDDVDHDSNINWGKVSKILLEESIKSYKKMNS